MFFITFTFLLTRDYTPLEAYKNLRERRGGSPPFVFLISKNWGAFLKGEVSLGRVVVPSLQNSYKPSKDPMISYNVKENDTG